MNLKQLEYFVAVAELGSFSKAAVILGIAQPVLSRQVLAEIAARIALFIRLLREQPNVWTKVICPELPSRPTCCAGCWSTIPCGSTGRRGGRQDLLDAAGAGMHHNE